MKPWTPARLIQAVREVICKHRGHTFRRAHKGEDQAKKVCVRCSATREVKRRKPDLSESGKQT